MPPEEKSPVDQVLDLLVFAPLGLAISALDDRPSLAAKGRAQVEGQLTMARFIGQFAVEQGKVQFEKRVWGPRAAPTVPVPTPPATPAPDVARSPVVEDAMEDRGVVPASAELAIHGYDALSASQVVQRLAGLTSDELDQVRRYETASRGRKTVLTKISQL